MFSSGGAPVRRWARRCCRGTMPFGH
jgi:hypothetical protein